MADFQVLQKKIKIDKERCIFDKMAGSNKLTLDGVQVVLGEALKNVGCWRLVRSVQRDELADSRNWNG